MAILDLIGSSPKFQASLTDSSDEKSELVDLSWMEQGARSGLLTYVGPPDFRLTAVTEGPRA